MTDSGAGTRRLFSRRAFATGAAAAAVVPTVLGTAAATGPKDEPGEGNGRGKDKGTVRELTLYMEKLPNGEMGYGLEPGKATIPGPLIEMTEGDTMRIEVVNNLDVAASLHVHGVDYDVASDGTAMNNSVVEPGGRRTYVWRTHAPGRNKDGTWDAGSAGYWHYHDHNVGTPHGTGGLKKGLYGPVIVRRKGDVLPDKQFTVVFNDMTINNKAHHDTPTFKAVRGERVEFIVITHGEFFHTFHVHGHRWVDNRTGILQGPQDVSRVIDTKTVGPADSFGFQVIAGDHVGAGNWMYHCHVQSHSDMGMAGLFVVTEADGTVPGGTPHH
ncbi:multicopper oxidase domain-containing protein [Streptomyces sp. NPDC087512]|uniref:multicopper oxidase domain-containing protein n=1 Tax=Streptomyces sp. NPDC087512 TaxID=3155059 RepID=UPI00343A9624